MSEPQRTGQASGRSGGPANRILLWVVLPTLVVYLPSLRLEFIADDFSLIEMVRSSSVSSFFLSAASGYYRPLIQLSFWMEHTLWGVVPFGYHATNLLLHLVNTLLVTLIAREVLPRLPSQWGLGGYAAGLYFGVTPTHASSVLWVLGRTDLLAATFYLLAIWLFVIPRRTSSSVGCLIAAILAMFCKEMALSLPFVCCVIALARPSSSGRMLNSISTVWPPVLAVLIYLGVRGELPASPLHETATWGSLLINIPRYAVGLVFPLDLEFIKPFFRAHPGLLYGVIALVAGASLIFVRFLGRDRFLLTVLAATALSLLPVVRVYAPWYLYIPSIGSALVVGRLVDLLPEALLRRLWLKALLIVVGAAHLFGLAQATTWASTAGDMASAAVASLARSVPRGGRAIVVSIPSEYRGVPVFGWIGNLSYAMQLSSHPITVDALVGVRLSDRTTPTHADVDTAGNIDLAISGDTDFFRLQDLSFLTGSSRPVIGQVYSTEHASIEVLSMNASGHPARLAIGPRTFALSSPDVQVLAFLDGDLKQLGDITSRKADP